MYSTGKFTKMVGVERNTMIVWLREGVVIPEPSNGRNNTFSHEEVLTIRAVAPLYTDWGIGTDILKPLAAWVRGLLSARAKLGMKDHHELLRAITAKRVSGFIENAKEYEGDTRKGLLDASAHIAKKAGLDLPDGWQAGLDEPDLSPFEWPELNNYKSFFDASSGRDNGWLSLAKSDDGWEWRVNWGQTVDFDPCDADCFIVVNLRKALAD